MDENQIVIAKIICKIRKADEPRWNKEIVFVDKKMIDESLKNLLNKYGRISKGSYQYSIKVLQYDEDSETKQKPAYSIVSNWKGKLVEVEHFIKEHEKRWVFAKDITEEIKKEKQKRIKKYIKKE
jgi:hypothetical protein